MASVDLDEVVRALAKKGFQEEPGGDHRYFRLFVEGRKTGLFTKVSRGGKKYKTLGDNLIAQMARQLKLTKAQFLDLIKCTIDGQGYVAIVTERLKSEGREV